MFKRHKTTLFCLVFGAFLLCSCGDDAPSIDYSALDVSQLQTLAQKSDINAMMHLSDLYFAGDKVEKNVQTAMKYLKQAAVQGKVEAQFKLGELLCRGDREFGIRAEPKAAKYWLEKAALKDYAPAQLAMGKLYETGRATIHDYHAAFQWYQKAADQGESEAQYALALMYQRGRGVRQDEQKAVHWYMVAAQQGHPQALYTLGLFYRQGRYVEKNLVKSKEFFGLACDHGLQKACSAYSNLHRRGIN